MVDYRRALARQRAEADSHKALDSVAARMPAAALTITDIAEAISGALADQRHEILEHVGRLFKLLELRQPSEDLRTRNLHARITALESELRRLQKGRPQ